MTAVATEPLAEGDQRRLPGEVGMWVFVLGDLIFFSAYFVIFMIYRTQDRDVFLASQRHLNLNLAVINTLLLLASSRFVALGVEAARARDHRRATVLIRYGALCGVAFILIKAYEWHAEISQGYTLAHNNFFMFYFVITGVHLFHVALGLIVLTIARLELRSPELRRPWVVEAGAIYWHMVDLVWVIIFAVIYVMR